MEFRHLISLERMNSKNYLVFFHIWLLAATQKIVGKNCFARFRGGCSGAAYAYHSAVVESIIIIGHYRI